MLSNSNFFLTIWQDMNLTLEQVVTYIVMPVLAGVAALWGLFKVIIPRVVEARLEDKKDSREYQQEQDRLTRAYHLSEAAVAQQMMAELLANSQEQEEKSNEFIRNRVKSLLDQIKSDTACLPDINKKLLDIQHKQADILTYYRLSAGILDDIRKELEKDRGNEKHQ